MNFSGEFGRSSTIWYPTSGYRREYDGSLYDVGDCGYYWSASPLSYYAYYLYFGNFGYVNRYSNNSGYVDSSNYNARVYGLSVRCLQESF